MMSHVDARLQVDAVCDPLWLDVEGPLSEAELSAGELLRRIGRDAYVQVPEGAVVVDVPTGGVL
ncbi:hypothetical protein SMD44_00980 [Streptomyces alboflavus]|uniref:Uncharacterized protein n=1 Tax=Streptomyces alboflavus TaxID=67267 RepID=A0A1Z1W5B6_9ACTN|nr:hypothetical protein [Streptomyces alboflavus]ARX81582.1 hypothetical protein SMD44_00980 [Streptomyces alboflavus]